MSVIRVEVVHDDGTVYTVAGEAAEQWGKMISSMSGLAAAHGINYPKIDWEIKKAVSGEG